MATYKYSAISKSGAQVTGLIDGYNELDAVDKIKQTCSVVLKVERQDENSASSLLNMEIGGNHLNSKAFTMMCQQFSIILHAGLPIGRTCHLIAEKTADKTLKKILKNVSEDVDSGRSMSIAFEDHGKGIIPPTFIETIRAGEASGNLDDAFQSCAEQFEKSAKTAQKVKSALAYPAFILVVAVIVVIVLMVKVVPTFIAVFDSYGSDLPVLAKMLIAVSNFFQKAWLPILLIVAVIFIVYKIYEKTETGHTNLAKWALDLPVFGNVNRMNAAAQFANTMNGMLKAGLPITKAMTVTARVTSNYYVSQKITQMIGRIEEGKTLAEAMEESGVYPDLLTDMVASGEESGELESTLGTIARYYDNEVEQAVATAVGILEPAALIFVGAIAGFIVLAVYGSMFDMYGNM